MGFLGDLGLAGVNAGLSLVGNKVAQQTSRENLDYMMSRYYSPQAQVNNLAAAGINPAVAFGNQSPVFSSGGQMQMPSNPLSGIGTTSLSDLANYINAKTNAKKAGVEMRNIDIDTQAKQFDLELAKIYKSPEQFAALTLAWKNVMLADDEHNIKEWTKAKEKALSQLSGHQRDTAKKVLDNMDIQIKQENRQREEGIKLTQEQQRTQRTQQTANQAAANASNASAELSRSQKSYQDIVNDIKESGKTFELESLIHKYRSDGKVSDAEAEKAINMLNRYKHLNENDKNGAAGGRTGFAVRILTASAAHQHHSQHYSQQTHYPFKHFLPPVFYRCIRLFIFLVIPVNAAGVLPDFSGIRTVT